MRTDNNGCSTCANGTEQYETFTARIGRKTIKRVQYDYRTENGELFSCVAPTLDAARERRDNWLRAKETITLEFDQYNRAFVSEDTFRAYLQQTAEEGDYEKERNGVVYFYNGGGCIIAEYHTEGSYGMTF